ncbi:hypothetical protein Vafri_16521 [Volvox africanus]|uniref:Complex 1 LYR protein domain-containing protein n=1 Tax=Volvox africanus TaxID=51714 RepID=A0A8J4BJA4_9CHLO|nr:hypothetical protein Vafri_16521 [Volvox africanus]
MSSSTTSLVSIYRQILKAAKYFPSRKRDNIIKEIKAEFHANKSAGGSRLYNSMTQDIISKPQTLIHTQGLADPDRIAQCRALAERGLSDLQAYVPASRNTLDGDIQITLKGATTSF